MLKRLLLLAVLVAGAAYMGTHNPRGTIAFGAGFNADTGVVSGPATAFGPAGSIAWVAHFSEPAGTTTLTRAIAQLGPGNRETPVASFTIGLNNAQATGIWGQRDVTAWEQELHAGPGTYVMRYLRGTTVLAQGTFTLTP